MRNNYLKNAFVALLIIGSSAVYAQTTAINKSGNPGNTAAVLDLSDATNAHLGLLLPNVSLSSVTDVATIPSPPDGLIVYNTNASITSGFGVGFYYWSATSTQWLFVSNTGAPGVTTFSGGTTGLTPSTATAGAVTLGGVLNVANGGTGLGTSPTKGQLLIGNGIGYTQANITSANSTIAITNGSGSIDLDLAQQGATNNQVLAWNGTQWAPQNISSIGLQNLTPGTGISGTTYNGSTAVSDWSVIYGNLPNTAVQGNTTFTVTAGTGLSGGGSIVEGSGGTITLTNAGVIGVTATSPIVSSGGANPVISFPSWPVNAAGILSNNGTGTLSWGALTLPNALTQGTGITSFSYNGSAPATVALANTGVTANAYGDALNYTTFTVNAQGQLTAAGTFPVPTTLPPSGAASGDLSGTYPAPSVVWANGYPTYDGRYLQIGATAGGDLSGTYPNPTVSKLLGNPIPSNAAGVLTNNGSGTLTWGSSSSLGTITVTNSAGGLGITGSPVALGGTIDINPNLVTNATLTGNGTTATPLGINPIITAGGPIGSGNTVPVITYNAEGQLTAVTTATITATSLGLQNLTPGAGITGSAYNGSTPETWAVTYGNLPNTAVQGNTTFNVTAGTGLSGGGAIVEGTGGTLTLNNTGVLGVTATTPISSTGGANPVISFPTWPADAAGILSNNGTGTLSWGAMTLPNSLTNGTGISSFTFNGSAPATVGLANTTVTPGSYGNAANYGTFTVNAQGQLTAASQLALPTTLPPSGAAGGDLSGTYPNPNVVWANGYPTYDGRYIKIGATAGGDLSGTYVNPTVSKINGSPLGTTTGATSGQALVWNGTNWVPGTVTSVSGQNLTPGTGLSGSVYNGSTAVSNWSVLYGSTANTAVQGNTTFSVTAGTGLSGGGSITEGAGGTVTLNNTGVLGVTATTPISSSGGANPVISFPSWPATNAVGVLTNNGTGTLTWGSTSSLGNITVTNTGGGLNISGSPVALGGTINVDPNVKTDATLTGNGTTATPLGLASVITAGGPVGSSNVVPVITYNAKGQLTAVSTASITATSIGMQNLTPGTGFTGSAYNGSTAVSNWTVNYGNTAGTAVQGNTTFTITAGTGMSGGGTIVEGSGGNVNLANTGVLAAVATAPVVNTGTSGSPVFTLGGTTNGVIYATSAASGAVTAASTGANQVLSTTTTGGAPTWQSFANLTNNGFILNQTSQQASSNFNISGTGTIGGLATLSAGVTETGGAASINASGANTTTIGNGTNALTENGNYALNVSNGAATTNIGTGTTTGIVSIAGSSNRVGIGNSTPSASTILDLTNTNASGGTGAAMRWPINPNPSSNIASPVVGDQVYNSTTGCFNYYNGSAWVAGGCPCATAPSGTITASCSQSFQGSTITYTSSVTTGVTFNWTVTATTGTPTVTGNGTPTITVTWPNTGAGTGTVSLALTNMCGTTTVNQAVIINANPTITGTTPITTNSTNNPFSCSVAGATYAWSSNSTYGVISGSTTNQSVTVNAASTAGSFTLTCVVSFGSCSLTATLPVNVTACSGNISLDGSVVTYVNYPTTTSPSTMTISTTTANELILVTVTGCCTTFSGGGGSCTVTNAGSSTLLNDYYSNQGTNTTFAFIPTATGAHTITINWGGQSAGYGEVFAAAFQGFCSPPTVAADVTASATFAGTGLTPISANITTPKNGTYVYGVYDNSTGQGATVGTVTWTNLTLLITTHNSNYGWDMSAAGLQVGTTGNYNVTGVDNVTSWSGNAADIYLYDIH